MSSEIQLEDVRQGLTDELKLLLPTTWDIKRGLSTPTTLAKPTVYVDYNELEPLPEAPLGSIRCKFNLFVVDHRTDLVKAEDAVDDHIVAFITVLDTHEWISWERATKKTILDAYLGWEVIVSVLIKKPTQTPEEG